MLGTTLTLHANNKHGHYPPISPVWLTEIECVKGARAAWLVENTDGGRASQVKNGTLVVVLASGSYRVYCGDCTVFISGYASPIWCRR